MTPARSLPVALVLALVIAGAHPQPASAGVCSAVGFLAGWAGRACTVVSHPSKLIKAGKSLATGHPGKAVKTFFSSGAASKAVTLAALVAWVGGGAKAALNATAKIVSKTTRPQLRTTWFSSTYWRMAGIAAILTLPFLFAAAAQAVLRSDLALLSRAALGYLPLSLLAVSIAAPLVMLLLAASDEMSAVVSSAAGGDGGHFLGRTGVRIGVLTVVDRSPFLLFLVALLTAAAAIALWIELLMREAAVYIVVLMLPLAFAAMVWPARRVWAVRTAELLVALILSKFVIVAVLALGAAALGHSDGGGGMLMGLVLVTLAVFSPWALVRMLPLAELASGAAGHLHPEFAKFGKAFGQSEGLALAGAEWAGTVVSGMRRQALDAAEASGGSGEGSDAAASGADSARAEAEKLADEGAAANGAASGATVGGGAEAGAEADDADGAAGVAAREAAGEAMASAAASMSGANGHDAPRRDSVREQRASNLPHPISADDLSWEPIEFHGDLLSPGEVGLDGGGEDGATGAGANPVAAEGGDRSSTGGAGLRSAGGSGATSTTAADGKATGEDHDPLPPEQEPREGHL
jgi:hypothetical protein